MSCMHRRRRCGGRRGLGVETMTDLYEVKAVCWRTGEHRPAAFGVDEL